MSRIPVRVTLLLAAILAAVTAPALADVEVNKVDWETIGPNVRFHVQFHNPDTANPSEPVSGQMHSQPYGAFVPNSGLIGDFNIPPIAPDSFFDVFFEVELSQLPPSGETITPGGGAGGILSLSEAQAPCPPPTFWNGNVDIFWDGPGGSGTVNYHFGQLQICPGSDPSYIHVILGCDDPAGIFWSFGPGCPGWTVSLVENAGFGPGGPAPNPIPSGGVWDGWICVSAGPTVPTGATCSVDLNMTCGGQTSTINVMAEACEWEPSTPVQPKTWGEIKVQMKVGNN